MLWELSTTEWISSFGFICCLSYIAGWLANTILEISGFGHIGNWLLLLLGAYTSMYVFNVKGYEFETDPLFTLACISGGAAFFFVMMCVTKRLAVR